MRSVLLITSACLIGVPALAAERALNVITWGGDFTEAQAAAFARPFQLETGVKVNLIDSDDPPTPLKAQVEAGNVTTDLASVGAGDALRFCDEGLVIPLDPDDLAPAPDGTPAKDDFLPGALGDCFVATDIYSTVIAFDAARTGADQPKTAADFFDTKRFPGKRGLGKTPEFTMELALLGDGVPAAEVYPMLSTPAGMERALAKLDQIRGDIIWWESGAQAIQLLADGEVAMTQAYSGRVFKASVVDGKDFHTIWDGQMYEVEGWVIPKGAPHLADARAFLRWTTTTDALAKVAEELPYGPPRRSSLALVGKFAGDGKTDVAPHLPTAPENMKNALLVQPEFWADHETTLRDRFNAWLVGG
ncbi:MAG: spermidine/putrescine ABC transporter substrate-binding protein [Paracoccus denitrificans]|nr:MAG: spermidine/putrescine ABC transporter substrate-binding protein [Paracoccus denitrificans]PZO84621.1 MAG: spermidine/putrescine ABC transporter substrate-binding protein [Paracoccus denitrificans]